MERDEYIHFKVNPLQRDLHASARLCENQLASTMTSPDGKKMEREEARSLTLTMRTMQRQ